MSDIRNMPNYRGQKPSTKITMVLGNLATLWDEAIKALFIWRKVGLGPPPQINVLYSIGVFLRNLRKIHQVEIVQDFALCQNRWVFYSLAFKFCLNLNLSPPTRFCSCLHCKMFWIRRYLDTMFPILIPDSKVSVFMMKLGSFDSGFMFCG